MTADNTRRPRVALCSGMSIPGRFSSPACCTGSIVIPPSAGGGGTTSGTSRIRGRSMTGSASSSGAGAGGVHDRGNSMILAVTGKRQRQLSNGWRVPQRSNPEHSRRRSEFWRHSTAQAMWQRIRPTPRRGLSNLRESGGFRCNASRISGSKRNRSDGYRGAVACAGIDIDSAAPPLLAASERIFSCRPGTGKSRFRFECGVAAGLALASARTAAKLWNPPGRASQMSPQIEQGMNQIS